ncbi:hypothetical protein GGI12_006025, partial [Dipsacomyces acuminosporus]
MTDAPVVSSSIKLTKPELRVLVDATKSTNTRAATIASIPALLQKLQPNSRQAAQSLATKLQGMHDSAAEHQKKLTEELANRSYLNNLCLFSKSTNKPILEFLKWTSMRAVRNALYPPQRIPVPPPPPHECNAFRMSESKSTFWSQLHRATAAPPARTALLRLAHSNVPRNGPNTACSCGKPETAAHLIALCPTYAPYRSEFMANWQDLVNSILPEIARECTQTADSDQNEAPSLSSPFTSPIPTAQFWLSAFMIRWNSAEYLRSCTARQLHKIWQFAVVSFIYTIWRLRN